MSNLKSILLKDKGIIDVSLWLPLHPSCSNKAKKFPGKYGLNTS